MVIAGVHNKEEAEKAMIAIGQEIIRRAKETCVNVDRVTSIKIVAEITPEEYANVNINKNYVAEFEESEEKENESNDKPTNEW